MRERLGLDLGAIGQLPFALMVRAAALDFHRPLLADTEVRIRSHAEFDRRIARVPCTVSGKDGKVIATCVLTIACVDRKTKKSCDWPHDFVALHYEKVPQ
jgi:acyl-CoA thioesterase FadM